MFIIKALVIVESPAKAKTIEKFLGKGYSVKASGGHVRDLPTHRLGVKVDENFEPSYTVIKEKKKIIEILKKSSKTADIVYLAPDPDREGEAIAWHLAETLKLDMEKVRRIEFNEITKNAVLGALENPREINKDRVDAQQARRILDRLVGYKLSPLLWKKIKKGLSAGRVQSVAVTIICTREDEINKFVPVEYWTIEADMLTSKKDKFSSVLFKHEGKKLVISNEEQAKKVLSDLESGEFSVSDIEHKKKKRKPAPPFITSTLQQEASRKLGWSAKKTMMVAQKLYEGLDIDGEHMGLITYMRTDSIRISDEAKQIGNEFIEKEYGKNYIGSGKFSTGKKKKNIQDAHEAIRPSYVDKRPAEVKPFVSVDEFKLYSLIWKRFISSLMSFADISITTIITSCNGYDFKTTGSVVDFEGFMKVYTEGKDDQDDPDSAGDLPRMEKGQPVSLETIKDQQHFTKPPARFTEATLVKVLEEKGIGRPSTYAPIISTIIDRGYVQKQKGRLEPTELGTTVNTQLSNHFNRILDLDFTADMESKLDDVMDGKVKWTEVMKDFYFPFEEELKLADENMPKVKSEGKPTDEICDKCGSPMLEKESRYGVFLACSAFPECRNTKPIVNELDVKCPKCDGDIVEKRTKRGKVFYGCKNYPNCDFAAWDKPTKFKCKEKDCGGMILKGKNDLKCNECKTKYSEEDFED